MSLDKSTETTEYGRTVALRFAQYVLAKIIEETAGKSPEEIIAEGPLTIDLDARFRQFEADGNLQDL